MSLEALRSGYLEAISRGTPYLRKFCRDHFSDLGQIDLKTRNRALSIIEKMEDPQLRTDMFRCVEDQDLMPPMNLAEVIEISKTDDEALKFIREGNFLKGVEDKDLGGAHREAHIKGFWTTCDLIWSVWKKYQ